ncbi:zinc ribbon domain regulatory protein CdsZ [Candidatus Clavichlamydia salmonicola]|uniref:zinc ribbon domain regulatory protein CdsZ n=1 Tax=Candidatus Clavichlamydia salmonicola TaxID=469812 RepID=UPI001890C169|nr:zinc ribbon domain-containing protein [Candidatus Clavichlamydia salmonicola]
MQDSFQAILGIQELDIKMICLMKVKREHQKELEKIRLLKSDIREKVQNKETELAELKEEIQEGENQIKASEERILHLESQQASVKKMDEFNALTQEMSLAGKERRALEHRLSDLMDKLVGEEDLIVSLKENLNSTEENSTSLEKDIEESIRKINEEGRVLLSTRQEAVENVDQDFFKIYERLLKNKKDRIVVPIENRVCSGCHIVLTPQHENLIRKRNRLVFCEHCSRILYWQDNSEGANLDSDTIGPKRRRRRSSMST